MSNTSDIEPPEMMRWEGPKEVFDAVIEARGILREWFKNDAEPHLHGLAEDDPGGTFCNECGGTMPCFTLRAEKLITALDEHAAVGEPIPATPEPEDEK